MSELNTAYGKLQAASGIKKGDTVRVVLIPKKYSLGWSNGLNSTMEQSLGKELTVLRDATDDSAGIHLSDSYRWPFFALEKIKDGVPREVKISSEYTAEINDEGGIKVGCQRLDFDKVEEIYLACQKVKESQD